MVKVRLTSSYGYREPGQARKYYGPGEVRVPEGLARVLGVEPLPESENETLLPGGFPGKVNLERAGYGTMEAVRKLNFDELVLVKGIGPATARAIILAAGEPDEI